MMICVGISRAKAILSYLVRRAEAGDEILITRWGRPVVRLVAIGGTIKMAAAV